LINSSNKQLPLDWDIPKYSTYRIKPKKKHNYCLVIPVINEGDRISRLIRRIYDNKIFELADTIIVDGGSDDGSLDLNNLKKYNVTALLVKKDSGKLSAQLRCAYSFAINEGYAGIITIDGNDKDDPKAIPAFIDQLNNGIDFIQASRFIKGGVSKNLPLSRYLAVRMIHAPLLSIFSGFYWTDTTQGFRAYSRKILLDSKVAPFRKIFMNYELLAYLSYRVPKLGFKCIELPTSRKYPKGNTPTKISSFSGNSSVLFSLLKACFGFYNPTKNV